MKVFLILFVLPFVLGLKHSDGQSQYHKGLKAPPKWEVFKTSWPVFDDQPRTLKEAKAQGWTKISDDCDRNAKFPGHRYAPPKREKPGYIDMMSKILGYPFNFAAGPFDDSPIPEIIVIYDKNGYIAGVHHVVTSSNRYEWVNGNQWYQTDEIDGKDGLPIDVEMTTLYFVDPHRICHGGRTEEEFEEQGTGNRLWLKNGPRPMDFLKIPLTKEDIEYQGQFFEHKCVQTMGTHWASTLVGSPLEATSGTCNSASSIPIALLTDQDGDVNGFLIILYGEEVKGYRYELPNEHSAPKSFKNLNCFLEYNRNLTSAGMHVYLKEDPGSPFTGPKVTCP